MTKSSLDRVFSALSHPTRRAVVARLALGEASVGELAAPFKTSLPAMSKHLQVLEEAGLLTREIDGRVHHLHLVPDPMKDAADWIAHQASFWNQRFDGLTSYLQQGKPGPARKWKRIHPKEEWE